MRSAAPAKPGLSLPIPAYRADAATAVGGDAVLAWAEKFDVIKASRMKKILLTTQIGEFADHAYPFADGEQRLLADCWCLWTLLVDELLEERLETGLLGDTVSDLSDPFTTLISVSAQPSEAVSDLCDALADLWETTRSGMGQGWQDDFLRHVAKFVRSCHQEAHNRLVRPHVTMAEFAQLRRGSFATDLFLDLAEKFESAALPTEPEFDGLRQGLRDCAADIGGWCNDVLSYRRESGNEDLNNLVLLLARDNACPLDEAVAAAVSNIHDRAWNLLVCKAEIITWLHENKIDDVSVARALRWANAVEALVSGSLTFQLVSSRWQEG